MFWGAVGIATGIPMAVWPRKVRIKKESAAINRLAEIDAGSEERYFEERRALVAYPPPKTDFRMRVLGIGLSFSGAALIVLAFLN